MKNHFKFACLALAFIMILPILSACGSSKSNADSEFSLQLTDGENCKYTIVRPTVCDEITRKSAMAIKSAIERKIKGKVNIKEDILVGQAQPDKFEILVGKTNRDESKQVYSEIKSKDYAVKAVNDKIVIAAHESKIIEMAANQFIKGVDAQNGNVKFQNANQFEYKAKYKFETVMFENTDIRDYTIVIPAASKGFINQYSEILQSKIAEVCGYVLPIVTDGNSENAKEILIGNTNRVQSEKVDASKLGELGYSIAKNGEKIVIKTNDDNFTFMKTVKNIVASLDSGVFSSDKGKVTVSNERLFNTFCFTDVHNNFAMLEPPYQIRKNAKNAIDIMLRDYGKMDVVFVGGDLMSDYPHWNLSGWLPYKFYTEYKDLLVKEFARFAKDEKVHYTAGNHDYAQGETYDPEYNILVNGGGPGPGKNGSYNSYEFYFTGPMDKTLGILPEEDMFWKISKYTGEKYLLAFYYDVNGIGIFGLAPDPDIIWAKQGAGFDPSSLEWLDKKLDEVDPYGNKVMFLNCHYHIHQRFPEVSGGYPTSGTNLRNETFDVSNGNVKTYVGHAPELATVLNGHKNMFHLFGHSESWFTGYTSVAMFHYDKHGRFVEFDTLKRTDNLNTVSYENRGFNSVNMGHFRPAQDRYPSWFENDTVLGYGGYTSQKRQPSTGTPNHAQGMYIEVYEDRVVFDMKNFGSVPGWTYEDKNETYTFYLYK